MARTAGKKPKGGKTKRNSPLSSPLGLQQSLTTTSIAATLEFCSPTSIGRSRGRSCSCTDDIGSIMRPSRKNRSKSTSTKGPAEISPRSNLHRSESVQIGASIRTLDGLSLSGTDSESSPTDRPPSGSVRSQSNPIKQKTVRKRQKSTTVKSEARTRTRAHTVTERPDCLSRVPSLPSLPSHVPLNDSIAAYMSAGRFLAQNSGEADPPAERRMHRSVSMTYDEMGRSMPSLRAAFRRMDSEHEIDDGAKAVLLDLELNPETFRLSADTPRSNSTGPSPCYTSGSDRSCDTDPDPIATLYTPRPDTMDDPFAAPARRDSVEMVDVGGGKGTAGSMLSLRVFDSF